MYVVRIRQGIGEEGLKWESVKGDPDGGKRRCYGDGSGERIKRDLGGEAGREGAYGWKE